MADITEPRMVYRGAADDSAETQVVADQDALSAALKDGWRLTRVPKAKAADVPKDPKFAPKDPK